MSEDIDSSGARVFQDINHAFKQDPNIDEYGVVPVLEAECNKSPVILTGHKLGLESWCVPVLYQYVYRQAFNKNLHTDDGDQVLLTRAVLLINAECYTVWNIRKELIIRNVIDERQELSFTSLILRKRPKSPETFSHRKWVFKRIAVDTHKNDHSPSNLDLIENEMSICSDAAGRHACNYYAWGHRIWILQNYLSESDLNFLREQLKTTEEWIWMHVSDHSGFHYRQFLLLSLKSSTSSSISDLLNLELDLTSRMINVYPDHEAIWCHRRFVIFHILKHLQQSNDSDKNKKTKLEVTLTSIINSEREFAERYNDRSSRNYAQWINRIGKDYL